MPANKIPSAGLPVQDIFNLRLCGQTLTNYVKAYVAAVERGDNAEIISSLRGLRGQVNYAFVWTQPAERTVNGTAMVVAEQEIPEEHDDYARQQQL